MPSISNSLGVVDKRHNPADPGDRFANRIIYTANGAGSTTTLVGTATVLNTGVNVVRISDKIKLFTAAGVPKEEKVFQVTAVNAAGTLVTFTPAALVATASTDTARRAGSDTWNDESSMDQRLAEINAAYYTVARLLQMTVNDKVYALRVLDDPTGV
jgi:hypothetical protein